MNKVFLKSGREKSLLKRHLWVYSGAVARVEGDCANGETVQVVSSRGDFLATAAISPASQLALRVWSFDENENINADFFRNRLQAAKDLPIAAPSISLVTSHFRHGTW